MVGALFETSIKYEILDSFLSEKMENILIDKNVNIIVDLKSVLHKVYRTNVNNINEDQKIIIEDIVSHVVNMIGFYRHYFYKNKKKSTFYILYSQNECEKLKNIYKNYKQEYYSTYLKNDNSEMENLNNIIKSSVKQIKTICKYIPNVFYINTEKYDEYIFADYIVNKKVGHSELNVLLSNDIMLYQILNKNTIAIDLKGINSSIITHTNVIKYITGIETEYSVNILNLLLSIAGYKKYSLNSIERIGFKKSYKILDNLIKNNKLIDKKYLSEPFTNIKKFDSVISDNINKIIENFNIINPAKLMFENSEDIKYLCNIYKPVVTTSQFIELNQSIFLLFPLNLSFILEGENIE